MITNNYNLPEAFVSFATNDKYTKGDSDISVTQLIDSPRVLLLREKHKNDITTDVMDMVWALFGTAVHSVLEAETGKNIVKEERFYSHVMGWTLSGAIDQYEVQDDGAVITDYKVTSVWSVIFDKQEWVNQLNVYAFLLEKELSMKSKNYIPVKAIKICAILRDWSRREARLKPDYPQNPVAYITIPLWTMEERLAYVKERMDIHQNARQMFDVADEFVECSDKERWAKPDTWAVKKKGNKRALRVFDNQEDAKEFVLDHSNQLDVGIIKQNHEIEHRKGENTRCKNNYCSVSDFCNQYKELENGTR